MIKRIFGISLVAIASSCMFCINPVMAESFTDSGSNSVSFAASPQDQDVYQTTGSFQVDDSDNPFQALNQAQDNSQTPTAEDLQEAHIKGCLESANKICASGGQGCENSLNEACSNYL